MKFRVGGEAVENEKMSPPSRVEWIEMLQNTFSAIKQLSPPSRVEWIEINAVIPMLCASVVSAFAGGVD